MAKQASNDRPLEQHDADLHGVRPKSQTLLCNIHRSVLPVLTWINRATGRIGKSIDVWQHASSARTLSELKERLMERKPIMHAVMFAGLVMLAACPALPGPMKCRASRLTGVGGSNVRCQRREPMPTCLHGVR
jgi:hypothetical protein